jgi:predicted PurR-regulated permease PerM
MAGGAALWLLGPLAGSWLALGIVDSITGTLGGLVGKPLDWVRSLVDGVVSWITDWVNHVIRWASDAFDAIGRTFGQVWDYANSIVTWAQSMVTSAWDRLVSWVGHLVADARSFASGLFNRLADWAQTAVNGVWQFAQSIVDWVNRNVWQPLWEHIQGTISWVASSVIPWAAQIVNDLAGWVHTAFDHVWGWIWSTVSPFIDWATYLLRAVERAIGWIVWVGDHPIDWVRKMWRYWIGADSRHATASLVDALTSESDMVADHLVRWLG